MSSHLTRRTLVGLTAATAGLALAAPQAAFAHSGHDRDGGLAVRAVNLVSDVPGLAPTTDPDLVNPWGSRPDRPGGPRQNYVPAGPVTMYGTVSAMSSAFSCSASVNRAGVRASR